MFDATSLDPCVLAIDFGASNTDVACVCRGKLFTWTQKTEGRPTPELASRLLRQAMEQGADVEVIGVTGGHHQTLPESIDGVRVVKVGELTAIARGGQALFTGHASRPREPVLVVSAGSGTAMVLAHNLAMAHVTGTGVGGGTLLGMARLLLDTIDPLVIDQLAVAGDPNGVDLSLVDVVSGPIGALPPDATAVNFGRVPRMETKPRDVDIAAALVTLVGQVIATLAINAARSVGAQEIVVSGHLTDMGSMRAAMARVGTFFGFPLNLYEQAGYATVLGALLAAVDR